MGAQLALYGVLPSRAAASIDYPRFGRQVNCEIVGIVPESPRSNMWPSKTRAHKKAAREEIRERPRFAQLHVDSISLGNITCYPAKYRCRLWPCRVGCRILQ